MPGPWNASTELRLLLCIIDPKATPKWDQVAARMGQQFSREGCRYVLPMKAFSVFAKSKAGLRYCPDISEPSLPPKCDLSILSSENRVSARLYFQAVRRRSHTPQAELDSRA